MPAVLITGASRGIGRATALKLAVAGWDVYAGVRSAADGAALVAAAPDRITAVGLDVTDEDQIAALDQNLPRRLEALVNNAGIAVGGALEAPPIGELRHQLEVNVIGQVAVSQAVLPRLRDSGGRIVFISSISGLLASPMLGAYAASKFAIEAISDAMRIELRPWRIPVIVIEPGQIDTDIWRTAPEVFEQTIAEMHPNQRDLYAEHIAGMRKAIPRAQKMTVSADAVATTVERALTAKRPKARYLAGRGARAARILARLAPTPLRDAALMSTSGVPRSFRAPDSPRTDRT